MTKIELVHPDRGFSVTRFTNDEKRGIRKIMAHHIHHVGKDFFSKFDSPSEPATGRPFENLKEMLR